MVRRTAMVALAAFLAAGCAVLTVRQGVLEGNVLYSSLVPDLKVKVGDDLRYAGRESRVVGVAIENVPTAVEFARTEIFRFEGRDDGRGLTVTLAHAPMDMLLSPGFQFEFLSRCLAHGDAEVGGRTVYSAVVREGDFLFAKFRFLLEGMGRASVTVDYREPIDPGDRGLLWKPKALSARERELVEGIMARGERLFTTDGTSPTGVELAEAAPEARPGTGPAVGRPEAPTDRLVAYPMPKSGSLNVRGR